MGFITKRFQTVGMKLFLQFFICIVLFVSVMGYLALQTSREVIQDNAADQSHKTITVAREKLDMIYQKYEQLSASFLADQEFQNTLLRFDEASTSGDEYNRALAYTTMNSRLQQHVMTDDDIASMTLYTLDGANLVNSSEKAFQEVDWFQHIVDQNGRAVWVAPHPDRYGDFSKERFVLGRVIKHVNYSSNAVVLIMELRMRALADHLANTDMGETGNSLIIDGEGYVIHSNIADHIGMQTEIDFTNGQDGNEVSDSYIGDNSEGVQQLVVFDKSEQYTGWYVAGTVDVEELVSGADVIATMTYIIVVIAALLAVVIGFILARVFGHPLVELRNLMRKGEEGDLTVRAKVTKRKDEIGQLRTSFNQMMEQIAQLAEQTSVSARDVLKTAGELSDVSSKTAISAREISVATEEIAGGATTLAVEAERGNELTLSIKGEMARVVESNFKMGQSAHDVHKVSEQGIENMGQLITKTNSAEQMIRSMSEKVTHLNESTASIRQILTVLTNITKQTNILSLNATIEAAGAGAAGQGFMVVADEIRKLADQSKQSIEIVAQITETIQTEIEDTVDTLSQAHPIFEEQVHSVREADAIFKNVQEQMNEFIAHLDDTTNSVQQLEQSQLVLTEAMANVSAVSEEASATSEEVASLSVEQLNVSEGLVTLSETLETLSRSLEESLSKFKTTANSEVDETSETNVSNDTSDAIDTNETNGTNDTNEES